MHEEKSFEIDRTTRPLRRIRAALIIALFWLLPAAPAWACYAIVVGCKASSDGSVLLGHAEQNSGRRILNFRRVARQQHDAQAQVVLRRGGRLPEVGESWAFLWSELPGQEFSDNYLNEWGVAVVSDYCPSREDDEAALIRRGEIRQGGIGYMLRRLIAQRARSAREGVTLAGELIEHSVTSTPDAPTSSPIPARPGYWPWSAAVIGQPAAWLTMRSLCCRTSTSPIA